MPQTPFGTGAVGQVVGDTFEKLKDQAGDIGEGLQDAVTGQPDQNGDSGIEQLLGGQQDPKSGGAGPSSAGQGLTPQQVAEKRAEEKKTYEFHEQKIKEWEEQYKQVKQEEDMKKKQEAEQAQAQKQQEIVELQQEEARAATLNPQKAKGPSGPGSAFVQQSTKAQTEFSKTVTQ